MGATTFMEYDKERARKQALKAKQAEAEEKAAKTKKAKAKAKAKKEKAEEAAKVLRKEAAKFEPRRDAKNNEPEEVTDAVHFQDEKAIDLDGDGKADVYVRPVS